jgi:hypothetical protein
MSGVLKSMALAAALLLGVQIAPTGLTLLCVAAWFAVRRREPWKP